MPNGRRQVPLDCWMAVPKSAAVSSSHFAESLFCALTETIESQTDRERNSTRFIDPPVFGCILLQRGPFKSILCRKESASDAFERDGHALAYPDAHGRKRQAAAGVLKFVDGGEHHARAGHSEG